MCRIWFFTPDCEIMCQCRTAHTPPVRVFQLGERCRHCYTSDTFCTFCNLCPCPYSVPLSVCNIGLELFNKTNAMRAFVL